ncbi:MAG: CvpA family protein [Pseudomonadota bacterium]
MTSFDYTVFIIIGACIIISMMRGAVREMLSIIGWLLSLYVAKTYSSQLMPLLPQDIPTDSLRVLAAFLILFLGVLLVVSLLSIALSSILDKIGLSWLNRFFGALFGFAKGLLIVCILVFLAGLTSIPKDVRWTNAMFSSPLEALVKAALPFTPQKVARHVKYD